MHDTLEPTIEDTERGEPTWNRALVWSTFGLIGWLALELTAEPGLAAILACGKCGWNDFRLAFWLRRA